MSIKRKIITAAATLTIAAGVGAATTLPANAVTPSCGRSCVNFYSTALGTSTHPNFLLEAPANAPQVNQPVILAPASGTNPGEDFISDVAGTTSEFYQAGFVAAGLALRYGCVPGVVAKTCPAGSVNDLAFEFNFAPYGADTGLCLGVSTGFLLEQEVILLPCGVNARTVWIPNRVPTPDSSTFQLISGATNSDFQHPLALTVLRPGLPLAAAPLVSSAPPSDQVWGEVSGVLATP